MKAEKKYMEESVKALTKRNKHLEAELTTRNTRINNEEPEYTHKFDISQLNNPLRNKLYRQKNRTTLTSANISKAITQNTNIPVAASHNALWQEKAENSADSYATAFTAKLRNRLSYL